MIVTIIMILTDWLMVGVTKLVYSCKVAYRQGMLFGVHVPGDVAELPEVKTMIEKYQSWMKAFYRWHFAIGTVICFLGMWYYVHLFYCMDCVDDGLFHRCYGQSLADTPAYV